MRARQSHTIPIPWGQFIQPNYFPLISRVCLPISLPMSAKARRVDYPGFCSLHASRIREVLLRLILPELQGWFSIIARYVLHCALHYSLSARPSLRASVTAPLPTSLALLDSASGDFT